MTYYLIIDYLRGTRPTHKTAVTYAASEERAVMGAYEDNRKLSPLCISSVRGVCGIDELNAFAECGIPGRGRDITIWTFKKELNT